MQSTRSSTVTKHRDSAGDYEVEIFDAPNPKLVIVTSHGEGVRRWDGKHFFHNVAEHYTNSTVMLVDQNQPEDDGCKVNPLPVMVARVQGLVTEAAKLHPGKPIVIVGHSMGCAIAAGLDLKGVSAVVFVAPGAGTKQEALVARYGPDIVHGRIVTTSDGLRKNFPAETYASFKGMNCEVLYEKLVEHFQPVYAFESGDEEIVSDKRFKHRDIPFTKYEIIPHATHNLSGAPLADFFGRLDKILAAL